jgi:hypothetical protein
VRRHKRVDGCGVVGEDFAAVIGGACRNDIEDGEFCPVGLGKGDNPGKRPRVIAGVFEDLEDIVESFHETASSLQ